MMEIGWGEDGKIKIVGRFDASEAERVETFLDGVASTKDLDLSGLQYVSSLGLGVLLKAQKRLKAEGQSLRLVGMPPHIRDIFRFSGLDRVFEIESP